MIKFLGEYIDSFVRTDRLNRAAAVAALGIAPNEDISNQIMMVEDEFALDCMVAMHLNVDSLSGNVIEDGLDFNELKTDINEKAEKAITQTSRYWFERGLTVSGPVDRMTRNRIAFYARSAVSEIVDELRCASPCIVNAITKRLVEMGVKPSVDTGYTEIVEHIIRMLDTDKPVSSEAVDELIIECYIKPAA